MNEALKCVITYIFETPGFKKLDANSHKYNLGSLQLLTRNNFTLDQDRKVEENEHNIIYGITK
jgi:RimJ/RimL family protein N-acetyltransferase